jgi:hypothetical protein
MSKEKFLVACNDPGGTMAMIPVITCLLKDRRKNILVFGGEYAIKLFDKQMIPYKKLSDYGYPHMNKLAIAAVLKKENPDLVITSTSSGNAVDNYFLNGAIKKKIITFALLDQWCNYSVRFKMFSKTQCQEYLPHYIGVMDKIAKKEMIQEGFPEKSLIVVGHPYFDALFSGVKRLSFHDKQSFRDHYGIRRESILIIFAAEPFKAKDYQKIGYTDIKIVKQLIKCLSDIANKSKTFITLMIKLHPRDHRDISSFSGNNLNHKFVDIVFAKNGNTTQFIMNADMVTGMSSIFLVESFLLGKPTLSIQIGLKRNDSLITNRLGLTKVIGSIAELYTTLNGFIVNNDELHRPVNNPDFMEIDGKATQRVVSFLYRIAR